MHRIIILLTLFMTFVVHAGDHGRLEFRPSKKIKCHDQKEMSEFESLPNECLVMIIHLVDEPLSLLQLNRYIHAIAKDEAERGRMRWVRQFRIPTDFFGFLCFLDELKRNRHLTNIKIDKRTQITTCQFIFLLEAMHYNLPDLVYLDITHGYEGYSRGNVQSSLPRTILPNLTELHISGNPFFHDRQTIVDIVDKNKIKRLSLSVSYGDAGDWVARLADFKNLNDLTLSGIQQGFITNLKNRNIQFKGLKRLNIGLTETTTCDQLLASFPDLEELIMLVSHVSQVHYFKKHTGIKDLTIMVSTNDKRTCWLLLFDKIKELPLKSLNIIPPEKNPRVVFKLDSKTAETRLAIFLKMLGNGAFPNTDRLFAESKDVNRAIEFNHSLGEQKALDEFLRIANELAFQKKYISQANAKKILNAFKAANFDFFTYGDIPTLASCFALLNQPYLQGDETLLALQNALLYYVIGLYSNGHFKDVIDIYERSGILVPSLDHRWTIFNSYLWCLRSSPSDSSLALKLILQAKNILEEITQYHENELTDSQRERIQEFQKK